MCRDDNYFCLSLFSWVYKKNKQFDFVYFSQYLMSIRGQDNSSKIKFLRIETLKMVVKQPF